MNPDGVTGGIALVDRFFIAAPDGGDLSSIFAFDFEAQAGRLAQELHIVGEQDQIYSEEIDLEDFVGFEIEIRDVAGFKDGTYRILFATDVAGRGIHVDDVGHIVNYDMSLL